MRLPVTNLAALALTLPLAAAQEGGALTLAEGLAHQQARRYAEAVETFEHLVEADPSNAPAWFNLGYSLHCLGELDRALEAHLKAASFEDHPQLRVLGHYNAACVHALRGDRDRAFEALEKSRAAGFANLQQVLGDSDLDSLRGDPRYAALVRELGGEAPAEPDVALVPGERALDALVGTWDVWRNGQVAEQVTVERILNDQALRMEGPRSSSLLSWVPGANEWRWTRVSPLGHHDLLVGGVQGGRLVWDQDLLRDRPGAVGRAIFDDLADGSTTFAWNVSADGGETWTTELSSRWVRRGEAADASARPVAAGAPAGARPYAFKLGHWDLTAERRNAEGGLSRGAGTSRAWWCADGVHVHDEVELHFDDGTSVSGTTYRERGGDDGTWSVRWEPAAGPAREAVAELGDLGPIETTSGTDAGGAWVDELRFHDVTEDAWSATADRVYEAGALIKATWSVSATRIR